MPKANGKHEYAKALALGVVAFCLVPFALSAQAPKRLLFLTHAGLYKHTSLGPAEKAVIALGKTGGFDVTTAEGYKLEPKEHAFSFLTPEYLAAFDVVMLTTHGNLRPA